MSSLRFAALLQRRLARRDRALLVVLALLVLLALVCALEGPHLLAATLDRAVRQTVRTDPGTDVVVRAPVGHVLENAGRALIEPEVVGAEARAIRDRLPAVLRRVTTGATTAVAGPDIRFLGDEVRPGLRNGPIGVRIALLPSADAVRVRSGSLPTTPIASDEIAVVLSQAVADAASLRVGSVLDVPAGEGLVTGAVLRLRVVGIVARVPATGRSPWEDLGPVWDARRNRNGTAAPLQIVVLTDTTGLGTATDALGPFTATVRMHVVPARLTAAAAPAVARAVRSVRLQTNAILANGEGELTVASSLPDALALAARQGRSAAAQHQLLTAGVLGTGAIAIVLLGGLITARRREAAVLQRARGASLAAVAGPALLESAAVVAVATLAAVLIVRQPVPPVAVLLAVVALLATPVQLAAAARGSVVRRAPANRSDRARIQRLRRARRIAAEAGLLAVAVVALLVLQASGLTGAVPNPLLLVAPLLVAAATTVLVLRLVPPVVGGAAVLTRRSRGVAGVLVAARARRAGTALPVFALCLAVGLALNDGLLLASIAAGQEAAAWDRVGADARASTAAAVGRVRAAPGVEEAALVAERPGTSVDLETTSTIATVLGVDEGYPGVIAALPGTPPGTAAVLRRLRERDGALPVVVDEALAGRMAGRGIVLQLDSGAVPARAVGTVADGPSGYLRGPYVFVDLAALRRRAPGVRPTTTLVVGPGSGAALRAAGVPVDDVLTRAGWLGAVRAAPLVAGTRSVTLLAAALLAVLAAAALSAAVLAGAPGRRRTLGLLRTLGVRRRSGWWLLVADLLPLVLGGLVGGAVVGIVAAEVLDPALALAALTGGRADPPIMLSGAVLAVVLAGVALVLAVGVAVEAVSWRRDRFAEVLRVGGRE